MNGNYLTFGKQILHSTSSYFTLQRHQMRNHTTARRVAGQRFRNLFTIREPTYASNSRSASRPASASARASTRLSNIPGTNNKRTPYPRFPARVAKVARLKASPYPFPDFYLLVEGVPPVPLKNGYSYLGYIVSLGRPKGRREHAQLQQGPAVGHYPVFT